MKELTDEEQREIEEELELIAIDMIEAEKESRELNNPGQTPPQEQVNHNTNDKPPNH